MEFNDGRLETIAPGFVSKKVLATCLLEGLEQRKEVLVEQRRRSAPNLLEDLGQLKAFQVKDNLTIREDIEERLSQFFVSDHFLHDHLKLIRAKCIEFGWGQLFRDERQKLLTKFSVFFVDLVDRP